MILGKAKHPDDCPPWAMCCDKTRDKMRETHTNRIVRFKGKPFLAEIKCPWCGRIEANVPTMRLVGRGRRAAAALPLFELDEGEEL
jgi:hypothetical protein